MRFQTIPLVVSLVTGVAGMTAPAPLHAQRETGAGGPATPAGQLESLSRERVQRWAATTPRIRCAPAPLTERPTAGAEFARLPVVPLESAFLDAVIVKRSVAARVGRVRAN
jgi:hypothetical protein